MGEDRQSGQRVTVDEAARHLGLTVDAVRKRVQRRQIPHEKDAAGRVRIILDESETLQDESPDNTGLAADELADELRNRIRYLERQVEEEREARRRADTLLAQLMQRIPELEAPQEASESHETVEEAPEGAGSHSAAGEATEELGVERARREAAETMMREGMTEERRRREEAERERDDLREQLYARSRQQGAHEATEEQQGRGHQPHSATGGAQGGARRPWWRRVLGR